MKKSLVYIFPAIMCLVGTHADAVTGWGNNTSVAGAWGTTAHGYTMSEYKYADTDENLCIANADPDNGCTEEEANELYECGTSANGCKYNVKITYTDYQLKLATDTLFQQVLGTLEREAQAQYNAKLTEEQNMCRNANSGGIIGRKDMTGTYRWVKLKKNKVPKSYATAGLTDKDITSSNDLYGSFCAARVTLQSDDADIQEAIRSGSAWSTTYFAVGDVFTCGSWIPQSSLESIAESVAEKKLKAQGKDDLVTGAGTGKLTTNQKWWLAGATVLSAGAGGTVADLLQTKADGVNKFFGANTISGEKLEIMQNSLNRATLVLADKVNGCSGSGSTENKYPIMLDAESIDGMLVYKTIKTGINANADGATTCDVLETYKTDLEIKLNAANKSRNWWQRGGRRGTIDAVAGLGTGLLGFYATRETMKDSNKREYDEAERAAMNEFMSNVGNHITCWIGSEEAGTFGDVVEVSME